MRIRIHVVAIAFALATVSLSGCRFPETKMVAVPPSTPAAADATPAPSHAAAAQALQK